jgi:Bacterial Ig-like domain
MKTIKLLLVMLFSTVIAACGGGGGGGGGGDTTAPTVSSVSPANNATGVALNSTITATFSEAMTASTLNATTFTLNNGATCAVTYTGTTATCTPTASLTASTTYIATISTAAKDLAGNALAAAKTWTFTTGTATTITGTAAAGAPVIGYVSVQDSSTNAQPVLTNIAIAADGKYSIDVAGLTPPFVIKAVGNVGGKQVTLYSTATSADVGFTINITPFTDLIVRNLAGTLANTLIDQYISAGSFATLTPAQINAARDTLQAQLLPVLQATGLTNGIDLLRSAFSANGKGLDLFMDLVKVNTTVPTAVTITNILDANAAANALTINTQTGVTTGNTTLGASGIPTVGTATPLDLIRQTFVVFNGYFATSLPSPTNPGLTALFAPSFLVNGSTSGDLLNWLTSSNTSVGIFFDSMSVVLDSIDTTNGIAQVSFNDKTHWQMRKVGNAWLFDGNQRLANIYVTTSAVNDSGNKSTGLRLWFENLQLRAIGSVVVTGPGLSANGVTITADQMVVMTDAEINALGVNNTYTLKVWSNAATPTLLGTYTDVIPRPALNTALATLAFPSLGGVTSLVGYTSGTLNLTWAMPAELRGDNIGVSLFGNGISETVRQDLFDKFGTGTANLVVTAPATGTWNGGSYWIRGFDAFGGEVITNYSGNSSGSAPPPATQPPPVIQSIVGSWSLPITNPGGSNNVLTFFANGDYMHSKAVTTNAGATPGIEHGTYTWDATTGAIAGACPPDVDTNGTDGFSHPNGIACTGSTSTTGVAIVNGDTMSWTVNGNPTVILTRVVDTANPLVGTWSYLMLNGVSPVGGGTNITITFFTNGDYMMAQAMTPPFAQSGAMPGLEHGTYTWNPSTGAFATGGCPPIDTNGEAGFSHSVAGVCSAATGTMTVSGNTLATVDNSTSPPSVYVFTRVTP